MTATVNTFALIGRSFPSETFEGLYQASIAARAERRGRRIDRVARVLTVARDAIVVPQRLTA